MALESNGGLILAPLPAGLVSGILAGGMFFALPSEATC
jgi:hypothetical protein